MSINNLIDDLNENQRAAATFSGNHALVLAGAGTGKTRTIIARTGYLINSGVPADRIQVLTFTRRSAKEIIERVKNSLGDKAEGLGASTFHTWCITLIRRMPKLFGCVDHTVIDDDDQIQIFKRLRGSEKSKLFPKDSEIRNIYSYARNTRSSLSKTLELQYEEYLQFKDKIAVVIKAYEAKKRERRYLDYDDILDIVATVLKQDTAVRDYVAQLYDYLLVDEMQDTNPLQWDLLEPLSNKVKLFCVGDDAQSIYGFRGADFKNVHSFTDRVPNSEILRLEQNYRSTQEILDLSNWLLSKSPIDYNKHLVAVRGTGQHPKIIDFSSEWEEGRWIADDLARRREEGADWANHMILARSSFSARIVETMLLARNIPYVFIGGVGLLGAAHIKDILSLLRIVANPSDEFAWMRFLTLFPKIGDVTANRIIEQFPTTDNIGEFINSLNSSDNLPIECKQAVMDAAAVADNPSKVYNIARNSLIPILEHIYSKDWDKRKRDFELIEKLIKKHTSILAFIEEYLLDPVHSSAVSRKENEDVVSIITIHSAKGTESRVCYVINVSPGSYPLLRSLGKIDEVEEERRVLYVALTRAQDELILTRGRQYALSASEKMPLLIDNPEYIKITNQIKVLKTECVKAEVFFKDEILYGNNTDKKDALESRLKNVELEMCNKEKELKIIVDSLNESSATYFLNDIPDGLIKSEIPEGKSSFWTDSSNLSERERPSLGIDLS